MRTPLLDYQAKSDNVLLVALIVHNPELSTREVLQLYGLKKAMEVVTPRELRGMFAKSAGRSWHRIMVMRKTYDCR